MASGNSNICPLCGATLQAKVSHCRSCGERLRPVRSEPARAFEWITNPSLRTKWIVGGGTLWMLVYFVGFFTWFCVGLAVQLNTGTKSKIANHWLWIIAPMHITTMLVTFSLMVFYVTYLFRSPRFKMGDRVRWLLLIVLFGIVGMPAFFLIHVWPEGRSKNSSNTGLRL